MTTIQAVRPSLLLLCWMMAGTLICPPAKGQTGEDAFRFAGRFPAVGVRMLAQGGATTGGVGDFSALHTNPAGLGFFRHSAVSGSLSGLATDDEGLYQVAALRTGIDQNVTDTRIGHLAYVYRFPTVRGSLVLGASFTQTNTFERDLLFEGENPINSITDFFMPFPDEFTLSEDADGVFPNFTRDLSFIAFETFAIDLDPGRLDAGEPVPFLPAVTRGTVFQTGRVTEEGSMKEVSFGGAFEASKDLMLGASVSIPFGTYRFFRRFDEEDRFNDNDGTDGTVDFDFLSLSERLKSELIGVNLRAGISAQVAPQVRIGLSVESPTYYSVDENFDTVLETVFDNGDHFIYGDNADEDAGSGAFEYNLTTPWRFAAGVGFSNAGLTVSADVEYVDWSQLELDADVASFVQENLDIRRRFDAVLNTRLGVEYAVGNVALRGGFAYQPDPRDRADTGLDRAKTFFSAGLGYRFARQFEMDLGWMQERFDDQYLPYTEVTDAPVVTEDLNRNRFVLGMRYLF